MSSETSGIKCAKNLVIFIDDDEESLKALNNMFGSTGNNLDQSKNEYDKEKNLRQKIKEISDFIFLRVVKDDLYNFYIPDEKDQPEKTTDYKKFLKYIEKIIDPYDCANILICVDVMLDSTMNFRTGGDLLYSLKNEPILSNCKFAFMTRNALVDDVVKGLESLAGNNLISRPWLSGDGYRKRDFEVLPNEGTPYLVKELRELHTTYWNFISNVLKIIL